MVPMDQLNLDDYVDVLRVNAFERSVPLDKEQIELVNKAYRQLLSYQGRRVMVRDIDEALDVIGGKSDIEQGLKGSEGYVLSLRSIPISSAQKKALERYERDSARDQQGISSWRPVVGNVGVYLAKAENSHLFIGAIDYESSIDGVNAPKMMPMISIKYQR